MAELLKRSVERRSTSEELMNIGIRVGGLMQSCYEGTGNVHPWECLSRRASDSRTLRKDQDQPCPPTEHETLRIFHSIAS